MIGSQNIIFENATRILRGQHKVEPQEVVTLAGELRKERAFRYARQVSAQARKKVGVSPTLRLELVRQEVLATYKDPDLHVDERLDSSLNLLEHEGDLAHTTNQEILGLAGAIYKDKWETNGQKQYLEQSLAYYRRGYAQGGVSDRGYTGINAAFVLDSLASLEQEAMSDIATERREQARRIREALVATLPTLERQLDYSDPEEKWWFHATVAEAYFGLGRYGDSLRWLSRAKESQNGETIDWKYESTSRQLASLARLQGASPISAAEFENSPPGKVLLEFLDGNSAAVLTAFVGKVGLALSGGGFRAALFHIGVLAKLAELDMLRSVEVLSCVSGGSIVGAHYYLEVRNLLQEKSDTKITREDYIAIIQRVAEHFLAGVQQNIRTRVAAEPLTNLKVVADPDYTRIRRIGELCEEKIFSRVEDGEGDTPRWLDDLLVHPKGDSANFSPKHDNWRRKAKVPVLILNATTLNTGHGWQFTASWMGESPASIDREVDSNYRMRRKQYSDAPSNKVRLGHAVAASACVPGIFEPLVLDVRYQDEDGPVVVHLVDGGVHDNQGIVGLLEQDCSLLLVSDGSGQLEAKNNPSEGLLSVPLRSNQILRARIRAAQYRDLLARRRASLLRGFVFVHLRTGLDVDPSISWVGHENGSESPPSEPSSSLNHGIPSKVQQRLAAIRTDLDSFADVEAYALMTLGYRMTEYEFSEPIQGFPEASKDQQEWPFLAVERMMYQAQDSAKFMQFLDVAKNDTFKIWRLSRPLQGVTATLGTASLIGLVLGYRKRWRNVFLAGNKIGTRITTAVAALTFLSIVMRSFRQRVTLTQACVSVAMSFFGWVAARVQLHLFDKWYLRRGRIVDRTQ
jgi:predicted acylesterase/phospholipase RssA